MQSHGVFDLRHEEVTGTTVTTPCPSSAAIVVAPSLLTITAGRVRADSVPTTGYQSGELAAARADDENRTRILSLGS